MALRLKLETWNEIIARLQHDAEHRWSRSEKVGI